MIECCHEFSRTSLRSIVGCVGYRDFDVRDADSFFCVCRNPGRAKSSDTARHGSAWSDTHLFCRGYCLCSRSCRVRASYIQVYESSESGIVVSHFCCTEKHNLFSLPTIAPESPMIGGWRNEGSNAGAFKPGGMKAVNVSINFQLTRS